MASFGSEIGRSVVATLQAVEKNEDRLFAERVTAERLKSKWKWLRCSSFASGPSTVSNSRQAPSWMAFRKLVTVMGFGSGFCSADHLDRRLALVKLLLERNRADLLAIFACSDFSLAWALRSRAVGPHPLRTVMLRPSLSSKAAIDRVCKGMLAQISVGAVVDISTGVARSTQNPHHR